MRFFRITQPSSCNRDQVRHQRRRRWAAAPGQESTNGEGGESLQQDMKETADRCWRVGTGRQGQWRGVAGQEVGGERLQDRSAADGRERGGIRRRWRRNAAAESLKRERVRCCEKHTPESYHRPKAAPCAPVERARRPHRVVCVSVEKCWQSGRWIQASVGCREGLMNYQEF